MFCPLTTQRLYFLAKTNTKICFLKMFYLKTMLRNRWARDYHASLLTFELPILKISFLLLIPNVSYFWNIYSSGLKLQVDLPANLSLTSKAVSLYILLFVLIQSLRIWICTVHFFLIQVVIKIFLLRVVHFLLLTRNMNTYRFLFSPHQNGFLEMVILT